MSDLFGLMDEDEPKRQRLLAQGWLPVIGRSGQPTGHWTQPEGRTMTEAQAFAWLAQEEANAAAGGPRAG
jgi:hypothetical protein